MLACMGKGAVTKEQARMLRPTWPIPNYACMAVRIAVPCKRYVMLWVVEWVGVQSIYQSESVAPAAASTRKKV